MEWPFLFCAWFFLSPAKAERDSRLRGNGRGGGNGRVGREWKEGGRRQLTELPFRRKPESHSRHSENFPRLRNIALSPVGEGGFAAEIPACAGMEGGSGNGSGGGNGIFFLTLRLVFLPPAACGGGASAIAVAGGGEISNIFGVSPPPKNSLCEFLPPPASGGG